MIGQFSCQLRKSLAVIVRPAVFDGDVLSLYESLLSETGAKFGDPIPIALGRGAAHHPITGIVGCCARAASGHAAAAPPRSEMISRRRMSCLRRKRAI
jgi:hypothetical protein